jgi:hypothetical protein
VNFNPGPFDVMQNDSGRVHRPLGENAARGESTRQNGAKDEIVQGRVIRQYQATFYPANDPNLTKSNTNLDKASNLLEFPIPVHQLDAWQLV